MRAATLPPGSYFGLQIADRAGASCRVVVTEYASGTRLPRHSHGSPYLCVALAGRYVESEGARSHDRARGGVVLNPCGDSHSDRFVAPARCANVEFPAEWLAPGPAGRRARYVELSPDSSLVSRLERAIGALNPEAAIALDEAAACLVRRASRAAPSATGAAPPAWLARVTEFIRESEPGAVTLSAAARVAGVHPSHLAREYRRCTGRTVAEEARRSRIDRAARDIRHSDEPLALLARRHAFADQAHMCRAVRAFLGVTPGELRRAGRTGAQF